MPRKKLKCKDAPIQVLVTPEDKEAFDLWCLHNDTTMSAVIRENIKPFIEQGKLLKLAEKQASA